MRSVDAIIPALNEVATIRGVVQRLYQHGIRKVWVVDNGSLDETSSRAADAGANVIYEPKQGYGAACLAGLGALSDDPPEWVLFCDADGSMIQMASLTCYHLQSRVRCSSYPSGTPLERARRAHLPTTIRQPSRMLPNRPDSWGALSGPWSLEDVKIRLLNTT